MKNFILMFSVVCVFFSCERAAVDKSTELFQADAIETMKNPHLRTWVLNSSMSDDFNTSPLNVTKWSRGVWYSNSGVFMFDNTNNSAFCDGGGFLHLRASNNGGNYTAGAVTSIFKVAGNTKIEIRAKCIQPLNNICCAIWMSNMPLATTNPNPEIDIQESMLPAQWGGGPAVLASGLHYWPSPDFPDSHLPNDWSRIGNFDLTAWHSYYLIRQNNILTFYKDSDSTPYWSYNVTDMPEFVTMPRSIVLSIEGHAGTPNLNSGENVDFLIDYVHVYDWK